MTFEEFFQKKKIDLAVLGAERPQLLEEFQKHFKAMGEKSFDHTKKYWFNKLRKSYPLKEEPPKEKVPASPARAEVPGAVPSESDMPAKPALGFKPRFKAGKTVAAGGEKEKAAPQPAEENAKAVPEEKEKTEPRPAEEAEAKLPGAESGGTISNPEDAEAKPAQPPKVPYKPRFRPGITPKQKE